MQSVVIGKNQAGQRLDKFLHKFLPEAGSGFLYKMLRKKNITLNGKKAEGREILALEDMVCFFFSDETFEKFSGRKVSRQESAERKNVGKPVPTLQGITVLYEDDDFLFVNKPAGILTQKAVPEDYSLNEWICGYLLKQDPAFEKELTAFHPSVCNRLDRNTSGIVLCGKSLRGLQYLSGCIRDRRVRKFYRTICVGCFKEKTELRGYLAKDTYRNVVKLTRFPENGPGNSIEKSVEAGAQVRAVCTPLAVGEKFTLLEVELVTGKSHQIRAQLAGAGHPLIGDFKYGNDEVNQEFKRKYGLSHQLLHACRVEFPKAEPENPQRAAQVFRGESLSGKTVSAPLPALFDRLQADLFS